MNIDLISREDLIIEITKQIAHFKDKANTTSINQDKLAYSLNATGLELARDIIDSAPTVEPFEKIGAICNENCGGHSLDNTFTRDELEAWLYANAANNLDGNKRDQLFADDCAEIIKRLDGFERFVKDRREGKI